ncbi:hypothetical protein DYB32_008583 [Aphanomyces invadans]|nr:hypothetical protein DYB32_008583 [Aphanomyces invadans]
MRPPPSTTPTPIVTSKLPMTTALPIDTINSDTSIYIGVSCGVLLLIVFSLFILWKRRQHRAELQEIETLRKEKEQEEMLHGDPVLFNTIGHQSLIASARSEPDAMWWASHAEKDDAQPPSTNQGATRLATSISSKSGIAEVPV